MATDSGYYKPKDTIAETIKSTLILGGTGLLISATQNALTKENVGAWGVFTRTGGTIAVFAAMGGTFEFARNASANLREKNDAWNATLGGFVAGSVFGLSTIYRTFPAVLGYGAALAVITGGSEFAGGIAGFPKDPNVDEYERKENLKQSKRRPIQETLDRFGEGRGIYGPGYDERRRERIKQKYGIDVPQST